MDTIRPEDAFKTVRQYACVACLSRQEVSFLCQSCRRVSYGSKKCQEEDWIPSHRAFCVAWTDAVRAFPLSQHPTLTSFPPLYRDYKAIMDSLKTHLMDPITKKLGSQAGRISTGLVFRAPRCLKCLAINPNTGAAEGRTTFQRCSKCVAQWCSNDDCRVAEQKHVEQGLCASLSQIVQDDQLFAATLDSPYPDPFIPPRIIRVETPPPLDWKSYLKILKLPKWVTLEQQNLHVQHSLSIPLTIVAALEKFGLLAQFSNAKDPRTLTIHIIGAEREFEVDHGLGVLEEITHLLPGVRDLVVVMIGPRLGYGKLKDLPAHRCKQCQRGRRTRRVELQPTTYHDFLTSNPTFPPPDLAVAFNAGICENPSSWKPTIDLLLLNQTPTVITGLNAVEAAADENAVLDLGGPRVELVWTQDKAPFPSGRKQFDVFTPGMFWSANRYWFGWRGGAL